MEAAREHHPPAKGRVMSIERQMIDRMLIGGNHLGNWAALNNWPHYSTPAHEALQRFGATMEYDAWCCWSAIMKVSKELGE